MLNRIWFWLLVIGILYGFGKGAALSIRQQTQVARPDTVLDPVTPVEGERATAKTEGQKDAQSLPIVEAGKDINAAILDAAKLAVEICITLIGIMALWLGLLRIAQDAGLVDAFAALLRPVVRFLFPGIPDGHPAQGAVLMNLSANMLGLENAATPFGLKAMRELQTLNPTEDTATDDMAMFLAINTSNITLIPFAIIGYRVAANSQNATEPLFGIIMVTAISTLVAIIAARSLSRWRMFAMPSGSPASNAAAGAKSSEDLKAADP